ncbi:8562_t:CDS:2 [Gigaspora rosea]|nr:8562_t:CDS:2 [Gigaspora rosea]
MDSQSSQTEFRYIDGRRFHNIENSVYHLPNDEYEMDRLHSQHITMRYIWQNNFSASIEHILAKPDAKILDIGCGAGSWSFDIATTYPLAKVIGLDISPIQSTHIKPKNFEFIKANAQEGLPFDDNTFDFVFQRFLLVGYAKEKWPYVINEIVRVLKPGGFLELCEPSKIIDGGPVTQRLWNCAEILEARGGDWDISQKFEKYLQNNEQVENINKVLVGNAISAYSSLKSVLIKKLQISNEEYDELTKTSEKELFELDTYFYLFRFYANKVIDK